MAKHSGKNGVVRINDGADKTILGLTGWDIEESTGTSDITSAEDAWKDFDFTQSEFKGSIKLNLDHAAGSNQALRSGDVVDFEGYTEGDGTGKTYYSGTIGITSNGLDSPFDGTVTRSYNFMGKGALSIETVSA